MASMAPAPAGGGAEHWDEIYRTRRSDELSWFQRDPARSLRLIEGAAADRSAAVIDVGGGTSLLVDRLLDAGFTDVSVLDVSQVALDEVAARLGPRASTVHLVREDVLTWAPARRYGVWHDRAVFHFLTTPAQRDRYVDQAALAVPTGGIVVLGTFAEDGPTSCSGLPVERYDAAELVATFAPAFSLVDFGREEHVTPAGVVQPFTWVVLRREP